MPGTRSFFLICLGIALLLLIAVPVLGGLFAPRTIPDDVTQGYHVWQVNGCAGCHALDGQGGAYASDLTHVYSVRGETYLRQFLLDPAAFNSNADRIMPRFNLTDVETSRLLALLKWTEANTVLFPKFPIGNTGVFFPQSTDAKAGVFRSRPLDLSAAP